MKRQTNEDLRRLFKTLNKLRFGNTLEEPDTIRFADLGEEELSGHVTETTQSPTVLEIDHGLKTYPSLTAIVMLHELNHLDIGCGYHPMHGTKFQAGIYRLMDTGAYDGLL